MIDFCRFYFSDMRSEALPLLTVELIPVVAPNHPLRRSRDDRYARLHGMSSLCSPIARRDRGT